MHVDTIMGAIEDVYADLDADVTEAEFRAAVEDKVEQMGGLADAETAAMLVAHELADTEVTQVADIEPGMAEVTFLAKVLSIGELRTFERDEADAEDGRVINVDAGDETGTVRLAFWDERAAAVADGQLTVGDVVQIKGRPRDGYGGLEVSVDRAEIDEDAEIDVEPGDDASIEGLTLGQSDVTLTGLVLGTESPRTFNRDDGSEGRVANLTLGDETGRVRVTLWDEQAEGAVDIEPGTAVEIVDGYVRERDGDLELHLGEGSAVQPIDDDVEYRPDATPIAEVELDDEVDIAGVVRSTDPKRTFDRDDGSEGQVRNVRIQDASGDIRVALWGDLADIEIAPGDEVLAADVEIQDGWQDDIEASAGWRSTVVVLDDVDTGVAVDAAPDAETESEHAGGLAAFTDDAGAGDDPVESERTVTDAADGEHLSFTGTVVQAGEPVILDDGTETVTVTTDQDLQLGREVTARGELRDGRLHAEEII